MSRDLGKLCHVGRNRFDVDWDRLLRTGFPRRAEVERLRQVLHIQVWHRARNCKPFKGCTDKTYRYETYRYETYRYKTYRYKRYRL
jgi:hypothetical protein